MFGAEFWVAVAFVLFVVLVGGKIFKAVTKSLDERSDRIRAELEEAVRLREEAQNLLAKYQRRQREAAQEAEDIVKHAREEAELIRQRGHEDLQRHIERRKQLAEEKIAQAEARAVKELRDAAVDIAVSAAERVIEGELDAKRHNDLIERGIEQARKQLH
tara:strand:- start:44 stop:523 length:480 start_codon:yes stop_codon:yes gene_type:complete